MMAQLQRMLESLRGAQARNRQQQRQSREAQEAMRRLQGIIQRQQRLLDDTFRRSQEGETGDAPLEESQEEQESIRRQLGELMQRLGEMMGQVPQNLGQAERSMRQSERALGQGQPSQAVGPQTEALEALRQGAQNAARALARRLGRGNRFGRSGRIGRFQGPELRGLRPGNRDPFGRPAEEDGTTGTATGNVEIPSEAEIQRAREILDELRSGPVIFGGPNWSWNTSSACSSVSSRIASPVPAEYRFRLPGPGPAGGYRPLAGRGLARRFRDLFAGEPDIGPPRRGRRIVDAPGEPEAFPGRQLILRRKDVHMPDLVARRIGQ